MAVHLLGQWPNRTVYLLKMEVQLLGQWHNREVFLLKMAMQLIDLCPRFQVFLQYSAYQDGICSECKCIASAESHAAIATY